MSLKTARLGNHSFKFSPEELMLRVSILKKNSSISSGFEPVILGSRGEHLTLGPFIWQKIQSSGLQTCFLTHYYMFHYGWSIAISKWPRRLALQGIAIIRHKLTAKRQNNFLNVLLSPDTYLYKYCQQQTFYNLWLHFLNKVQKADHRVYGIKINVFSFQLLYNDTFSLGQTD